MSPAAIRNRTPAAVRSAAVALCALIAVALLLSSAVLVTRAHHEHDHDGDDGGCAACEQLCAAGCLLCSFGAAMSVAAIVSGQPRRRAENCAARYTVFSRLFSLVALNVRLNI
jgi:hypothetical protein